MCSHLKCDAASPCFHCERRNIECVYLTQPSADLPHEEDKSTRPNADVEMAERPTKMPKLTDFNAIKMEPLTTNRITEPPKEHRATKTPPARKSEPSEPQRGTLLPNFLLKLRFKSIGSDPGLYTCSGAVLPFVSCAHTTGFCAMSLCFVPSIRSPMSSLSFLIKFFRA